jgi:hypothetical protein
MQVDIVIKEKAKGSVLTQNSTASGQASVRDGKKSGFVNGCGCILRSKTRVKDAHCPIARW